MKRLAALIILGALLASTTPVRAQGASDWPSLNFDAGQTNDNVDEIALTARNVLKLKVHWTAPIADVSYPVIANSQVFVPFLSANRVHVRVLDIATGKQVAVLSKDALGGLLAANGDLYLAGRTLQEVDPSSGQKLAEVDPSPAIKGGTFLDPVADQAVLVAGYAGTRVSSPGALYGVDLQSGSVLWKLHSANAPAAFDGNRVITETAKGGAFFDETSGRQLASRMTMYSSWFAGGGLAYTVAVVKHKSATLFAYSSTGHVAWHRVVGPNLVAQDWPHALGSTAVFVATEGRIPGVEAIDPQSGQTLWHRAIPNVERLALANGLLYVLSFGLGQPVRLIVLHASTGKPVGAIVLSSNFYAFGAANGLMVAEGMVFIRAIGPTGPVLVALGL